MGLTPLALPSCPGLAHRTPPSSRFYFPSGPSPA
uniref:Uncharacterized protein n=1 Tax=Arundo donax TaxID=35708 RepID=A0A0A8ZZP8_ARUDO